MNNRLESPAGSELKGAHCRCTFTSGTLSAGSQAVKALICRSTSLAAKALIAAANLIQTLITILIRLALQSFCMALRSLCF
jgi:hypothetical protein